MKPRFKLKSAIGTPKDTPKPSVDERLGKAMEKISDALEDIQRKGGINEEAIMILLMAKTKLGRKTIQSVLDAVAGLHGDFGA